MDGGPGKRYAHSEAKQHGKGLTRAGSLWLRSFGLRSVGRGTQLPKATDRHYGRISSDRRLSSGGCTITLVLVLDGDVTGIEACCCAKSVPSRIR